MELLATMVNSRKMLTIVAKNTTLDVTGFLWRGGGVGGYIWDVNWLHISGAYIKGVLIYKGHINGILRYFHLESKLLFF